MKARLILICALLGLCGNAFAQGIIHTIDGRSPAVLGGIGLAGSLGGGIPLWVKGRRELDWILDDYAERYAPRPYAASITAGPTRNGFGLALNF